MTIRQLLLASLVSLGLGGCSISFMGAPSSAAPNQYGYNWGKTMPSGEYRHDDREKPLPGADRADDDDARPAKPQRDEPAAKPPERKKPAPQRTKPQPSDDTPPTRRPTDDDSTGRPSPMRPVDRDEDKPKPTRPTRPTDDGSTDRPSPMRPVDPVSKPAPTRRPTTDEPSPLRPVDRPSTKPDASPRKKPQLEPVGRSKPARRV